MNGTHYWEYKKYERQSGMLNEEAVSGAAEANRTTGNSGRGESAGRSGWKGPGTLWIAESEALPGKRTRGNG